MATLPDPRTPTLAGRLLELRALIQNARWTMLDAVVMVNDLYDEAVRIEQAHIPTLGPEDPEPNHEDYQPGDGDES
jgi:hypothetical protein